ncbi:hypothetical protein [Aliarcobacter vitoriensis]|uniref:Septum formation initiator n=1 Tax=Aliarcobacter vitoriensis TaxID=2011099 RepID=A0A366MR36_9BACT|nr:hypothetical protein [Aliarcobacter vitoriensis]RBQ28751.1 hypothetical protein CRU91_07850 [Aliarcobacter vitoriensis]RBQ31427.1 hypothetical protein CRU92_06540 [Arcobacter sp. FW59]
MFSLNAKNSLTFVLIILFVGLFMYIPKIYVSNNIYYTSKDINRLYSHYISLNEENTFLSKQLEDMKFKNQVIDSLLFNPLIQLEQK